MGLKDNIPTRTILLLLIVSTLSYGISNIISYKATQALPVPELVIALAIGAILGAIVEGRIWKVSILKDGSIDSSISILGGLLIGASVIIVILSYKFLPLTSVYPLVVLSAVVFFAIDVVRYGKKLTQKELALLSLGILFVGIGTFLAESNGFSFNIAALPAVFGIAITSGAGFYCFLYELKRHKEGLKLFSMGIWMLLYGVMMFVSNPQFLLSFYFAVGIISGFILAFAMGTEMHAMRLEKSTNRRRDVVERNFINNFTYLDLLIVIAGGILINSYTVESIFGGLAIVIGVLIIGNTK